jgi:hypothetical protein
MTRKPSNPFNQYVLLADAFLDGRLHLVDPPDYLELARFGGRAYVIDPPVPAVLLLPFVAMFGAGLDQVLVGVAVGAGSAGLFWVAARSLWTDVRFAALMTVLLAFGTTHWWAATDGGLWTFGQTTGLFFALGALVAATRRARPWLVGILLGLAALSRLPVFLTAPLYAYLVVRHLPLRSMRALRRVALFSLPLVAAVALYLGYNLARYGTPLEAGYGHEQYLELPWFDGGLFHPTYVGRHIEAIFFTPPVRTGGFPYFRPSALGMALFLTSPALLYAFRSRLRGLQGVALGTLVLAAIPIVTYGSTGWSQFGYRFSIDVLPPMLLLVASGMRERATWRAWTIVGISVVVNLWGVLAFNRFDWVA